MNLILEKSMPGDITRFLRVLQMANGGIVILSMEQMNLKLEVTHQMRQDKYAYENK